MAETTEPRRETRLPPALRPFRAREYRLLALSLGASLTAGGVWLVALVYEVIALGGGPGQLSLVTAAAAAGLVLAVPAGGIAADRLPRRLLLAAVESVRALAAGLAARLAPLPSMLPDADLLAANGVEGVLRPAAQQAGGPALAGPAVTMTGPGGALALAAAAYFLALVPLPFLRPVPRSVPSGGSPVQDFREGVQCVRRTGWLLATLVFAGCPGPCWAG